MRKVIFAINVTIDGFADHEVMIADKELHDFFTELLGTFDILLFGRKTYELMESYWPNARKDPAATESMKAFADKINSLPKMVFSKTLKEVTWEPVILMRSKIEDEILKLKNQPGKNISINGLSIAAHLTALGLIDEYWFLIHPVIAGKGKPLFETLESKTNLTLIETKNFQSGVVAMHYTHKTETS
jgi:dihydrofolate reductase